MIVSCPNCNTAYNLPKGAITSEGRKIRCKRCDHVFWARTIQNEKGEIELEIFYKGASSSNQSHQSEDNASEKRNLKSIKDFDKNKVKSKLGNLFGASLALQNHSPNQNQKKAEDNTSSQPTKRTSRGTVMGIPIASITSAQKRVAAMTKMYGNEEDEDPSPAHTKSETSYGMPSVARDEHKTPVPGEVTATKARILREMSARHISDVEETRDARRGHKTTLWMLADEDDEALAAAVNKLNDNGPYRVKENSEAEEIKTDDESLTGDYEDTKRREALGGFAREGTLHLGTVDENDETNENRRASRSNRYEERGADVESKDRGNHTLFGLVSPIIANNTDFDNFLNDENLFKEDFDKFLAGQDEDLSAAQKSSVESLADYSPKLNNSEKNTGRRLANFLSKGSLVDIVNQRKLANEKLLDEDTAERASFKANEQSINDVPEDTKTNKVVRPERLKSSTNLRASQPRKIPVDFSNSKVDKNISQPHANHSDKPEKASSSPGPIPSQQRNLAATSKEPAISSIRRTLKTPLTLPPAARPAADSQPSQPPQVRKSHQSLPPGRPRKRPTRHSIPVGTIDLDQLQKQNLNSENLNSSSNNPAASVRHVTGESSHVPPNSNRPPSANVITDKNLRDINGRGGPRRIGQPYQMPEETWDMAREPRPKYNEEILFDKIENTEVIPRQSNNTPSMKTPSESGNLIIWIMSAIVVLLAGLLVAYLIVKKLG